MPGLDDVLYNPALFARDRCGVEASLRPKLVQRIIDGLERDANSGAPQHLLILGERGSGKTMLLRSLARAIEACEPLRDEWFPLAFPEAQYDVGGLADLWTNALDYLRVALHRRGHKKLARSLRVAAAELDGMRDEAREDEALRLLLDASDTLERRFILLVDNLDVVLDRLKAEQWRFRDVLSEERRILVIGASARAIEATYHYDAAFYDFFQLSELRRIPLSQTRQALAKIWNTPNVVERLDTYDTRYPGGLDAVTTLVGTLPRTLALVAEQLERTPDTRPDWLVLSILDRLTPEHQARIDGLAPQSQRVLFALATGWDPMRAADVASRTRLSTNAASAQLNRLVQDGYVEKVPYPPGSRLGFQLRDRRFGVWFIMRAGQPHRRRLVTKTHLVRHILAVENGLAGERTGPLHAAADLIRLGRWNEAAPRLSTELAALPPALDHTQFSGLVAVAGAALASGRADVFAAQIVTLGRPGRWRFLARAIALAGDAESDVLMHTSPELRPPLRQFAARIADAATQ
ncbi:MAG: hypothetical protein ACI9MR_000097 [Myxococcota bacterium]|jgi:hypothetical protein